MNEDVAFLQDQVDRHHAWFSESLPMIASENLISRLAREMHLCDFQDRYAQRLLDSCVATGPAVPFLRVLYTNRRVSRE